MCVCAYRVRLEGLNWYNNLEVALGLYQEFSLIRSYNHLEHNCLWDTFKKKNLGLENYVFVLFIWQNVCQNFALDSRFFFVALLL